VNNLVPGSITSGFYSKLLTELKNVELDNSEDIELNNFKDIVEDGVGEANDLQWCRNELPS
jgi:hypothetical protein